MLACGAIFRFSHAHWESEFYDLIQGMSSPSLSRNHLSECNAMRCRPMALFAPAGHGMVRFPLWKNARQISTRSRKSYRLTLWRSTRPIGFGRSSTGRSARCFRSLLRTRSATRRRHRFFRRSSKERANVSEGASSNCFGIGQSGVWECRTTHGGKGSPHEASTAPLLAYEHAWRRKGSRRFG